MLRQQSMKNTVSNLFLWSISLKIENKGTYMPITGGFLQARIYFNISRSAITLVVIEYAMFAMMIVYNVRTYVYTISRYRYYSTCCSCMVHICSCSIAHVQSAADFSLNI